MAAHGRLGLFEGGRHRFGHVQSWSVANGTPEFVHVGRLIGWGVAAVLAMVASGEAGGGGQEPIEGKLTGIVCNCEQQSLDR